MGLFASKTHSDWNGKMIRRNDGHATHHSVQRASSSSESAFPTPSFPVGDRSRTDN